MTETPLLRWSAIVLSVTAMALGGNALWQWHGSAPPVSEVKPPSLAGATIAPVLSAAEQQVAATPRRYVHIQARPLFSPWRAPPEMRKAAEAPKPTKTAAPVRLPPKLAKGQVQLLGVVIDSGQELALIRAKREPEILRLSVGDDLDGWRLSEISPDSISLEQDGVVETVLLRDTEANAVPGRRPVRVRRNPDRPQPIVQRGNPQARQPAARQPAVDNRLTRFRTLDSGKGRQPLRKAEPK